MKFESKRNCRREQLSMNVDPVDTDRDTHYISQLIAWLPIELTSHQTHQKFIILLWQISLVYRLVKLVRSIELQFGRYEFHQFNFDRNKFECVVIFHMYCMCFFFNADSWAESVFVLRVARICSVVIVRSNESSWKLSGGNKSV